MPKLFLGVLDGLAPQRGVGFHDLEFRGQSDRV
jgi:hypothetical protein